MTAGGTVGAQTGSPVLRTVAVGTNPDAVAVDERTGHVFVVNAGQDPHNGSVSVLDARGGAMLRTVAVGTQPDAVAVDERAGRVFVVNAGSGTVSVLDARSGIVLHTSADPLAPRTVAVDEKTGRVFVANGAGPPGQGNVTVGGSVSVLDARSGAVLSTVPVGLAPFALAVDEKHGLVFVANQRDNNVSVLDARTGHSLGASSSPTATVP
jgi:YVTN family beta-propeller protein